MRRTKAFALLLGVFGATFAGATPVAAAEKDDLVDRIVAKADRNLLEVLVTTRGEGGKPRFDTVRVPDVAAAKRVVSDMLGRSGVVAVEMNRLVSTAANDPLFRDQWALDSRHFYFDRVREVTRSDLARPYIAVVDSGVQGSHPDLAGHLRAGVDTTGYGSTADDCGHGTHVAGIIAATANNSRGVVGLAQRAWIRPVKVLRWRSGLLVPAGCYGDSRTVAEGISWAADHAHIISLSLEASSPSEAERAAVGYAKSRGRAVIAAAGNGGDGEIVYPAGYASVIGVGAVAESGSSPYYWTPADFSNPGPWVDVAGPGVSIASTVPPRLNRTCRTTDEYPSDGSGYCFLSGTSMATPYVSATVALAQQHCRWSTAAAVTRMAQTASHYPRKYAKVGYGVVNPLKLLRC